MQIYDNLVADVFSFDYVGPNANNKKIIKDENISYWFKSLNKYESLLNGLESKIRYVYKLDIFDHPEFDHFLDILNSLNIEIINELENFSRIAKKASFLNNKYSAINFEEYIIKQKMIDVFYNEAYDIIQDGFYIAQNISNLVDKNRNRLFEAATRCIIERSKITKIRI